MKLHLGCGNKILRGFVNIDIRVDSGCDVVDDISKLSKIEDGSVSMIYASHVLEHFGRFEYINVLKRWYDVLESGGILRVSVPDFESIFEKYSEGVPLDVLIGLLYGGQSYPENYHYMGFDFNKLEKDLMGIGFSDIKRWDWRETEHSHVDDFSQAYLPHMDKENGKLMSLNVECKKI